MDFLRTAYNTLGYSFDPATGDLVPFPMDWIRAPVGAVPLPVPHQYASRRNYAPTKPAEQVGEILTDNPSYSKGATPPGVLGTNYCGGPWKGPLVRLTTRDPSNDYGQPLCCDVPSLCQGTAFHVPQLDAQDGSGFHAMTHIGVNRYRLGDPAGGAFFYQYGEVVLACGSRPHRAALWTSATLSGSPVVDVLDLYAVDNTTHEGSWFVPVTGTYNPGHSVVLLTP